MKPVAPCQECLNRHIMCHEHCLEYQDYKSKMAELKRLKFETNMENSYFRMAVRKAKKRAARK